MADARDNQKEEPKENEDLRFGTNGIGRMQQSLVPLKKRWSLQQERSRNVEMQRRGHEKESSSVEKTMGPPPVMGLSYLGRMSYERTDGTVSRYLPEKKGKEDSVLRINEAGQIRDYQNSYTDTREVLQKKTPPRDSESQWIFDERTQRRLLKRTATVCRRCCPCRNGRSCRYNHPTQIPQVRTTVPICKYLMKGYCKLGSVCGFQHINDRNGPEPMHQASPTDARAQRRYETEYSGSRPEKKAKTTPDSRECDSRDRSEDIDEGEIRERDNPQEQIQRSTPDPRMRDPRRHATKEMEQTERQMREAQYNLQEQRSIGEGRKLSRLIKIAKGAMQMRDAQKREAQENMQQHYNSDHRRCQRIKK
ncbi:putative zinc finger CCCH domain-containing protein 9 isoform X2 [Capsella rubella]|uniref:putative zinc finger CCCH domain-containing protein 9 isoform X2 n=1 Tax=Capsella rubella TaxID=81985 RepID=UPI000CD55641|nr:putative zinc finger CCCH domain-containing protein 9 isoform X2 [Capsella rubella]